MDTKNMKECADIQILLNAYVDNELTARQNNRVSNHIAECKICRSMVDNQCKIKEMIKSSYTYKEKVDFSKNIMMNIQLNNKYGSKRTVVKQGVYKKAGVFKNKLLYAAVAVALILAAASSTAVYFDNNIPAAKETAAQDKYEAYILEHYSTSYANQGISASIRPVNFER